VVSTEIAIILLLLVANGIFAMAEIAVVASRRTRLQHRAERGDRRAAAALRLAQHPTQFLSTVQVGITLVGIFAGAYGGATLADPLAERLAAWPWLAPYSRLAALAVVVTAITYFSLVIGELVPKAIALSNPEGIAARVAAPLAVVARVTTPFVRVLSASTSVVLAVLRVRVPVEHRVTEEEIRSLIKQAAVSGDVAPVEQKIVEQVFRLGDRRVSGIMTPRHDIDWFDIRQGLEALGRHVAETRHARSLVCDGSLDAVLGVLHAEDLLEAMLAGRRPDIAALLRPPLFVPATLSVFELLERFRSSRVHVALVLDEFGAIEGLVTPTDILEGLVGEMPAEEAPEAGPMVQREDGSWLVDGTTPLEDLGTAVSLPPVPAGEEGAYRTLAGLVMTRLGRVPRVGDRVVWGGYRLEVVDMDGRRVDKVLIEPVSGGDAAASKT
jgi:putative hemolysin